MESTTHNLSSPDFDPEKALEDALKHPKTTTIIIPKPNIPPLSKTSKFFWTCNTPLDQQISHYLALLPNRKSQQNEFPIDIPSSKQQEITPNQQEALDKLKQLEKKYTKIPDYITPSKSIQLFPHCLKFPENTPCALLQSSIGKTVIVKYIGPYNTVQQVEGSLSSLDADLRICVSSGFSIQKCVKKITIKMPNGASQYREFHLDKKIHFSNLFITTVISIHVK